MLEISISSTENAHGQSLHLCYNLFMLRRRLTCLLFLLIVQFFLTVPASAKQDEETSYIVRPGDTWTALAIRLSSSQAELMKNAGAVNPQRQPIIGSNISLYEKMPKKGRLIRPVSTGLLEFSVHSGRSPWFLSLTNEIKHPYSPLTFTPLFVPGGTQPPRELPIGFNALVVSALRATVGQALMLQGNLPLESQVDITLDSNPWIIARNEASLLAFGATDAFFGASTPELRVQVEGYPLWVQPWLFIDNDWHYERISFPTTAATDREAILQEREMLRVIWQQVTPVPLWTSNFKRPLQEYIELTSPYGARRSINGGPYNTFHEGIDFSAYRGTPVHAASSGRVVIGEELIVRGGAVILDHGLGFHTGYYHLSEIAVEAGDFVNTGDILGQVGSTGRSTGNHLHWDLLVGTTWIDAEAWIKSNIATRALVGWENQISQVNLRDMPSKP